MSAPNSGPKRQRMAWQMSRLASPSPCVAAERWRAQSPEGAGSQRRAAPLVSSGNRATTAASLPPTSACSPRHARGRPWLCGAQAAMDSGFCTNHPENHRGPTRNGRAQRQHREAKGTEGTRSVLKSLWHRHDSINARATCLRFRLLCASSVPSVPLWFSGSFVQYSALTAARGSPPACVRGPIGSRPRAPLGFSARHRSLAAARPGSCRRARGRCPQPCSRNHVRSR